MKKTIALATVALAAFLTVLTAQQAPPPGAPQPLIFPDGLMKYLPDSIKAKWDDIVSEAIAKGLPSEYLYTFLPDSIARQLPDSLEKFIPKDDMEKKYKRPFTAKDLMSLKRITDFRLSPDQGWLVITVKSPSIKANKFYTNLMALDVDNKRLTKVTTNARPDYNPRFAPKGFKLAFTSQRLKTPQIFIMDFPLGKPKPFTDEPYGADNPIWSPDGKYIAYTADVKIGESLKDRYPDYPKANVRIYDDLPVRHWSEWEDEKYSHLFIKPVSGGKSIDLTPGEPYDVPLKPFGGSEEICWSPDGKEIAYVGKKVKDYVYSTNSDIYVYNLKTKKTRNITKSNLGYDLDPLYSPNGKYLAYISQKRPGFESDKKRLMIYDLKKKKAVDISANFPQWVEEKVWAPDSKSIFFTAPDSGTIKIFRIAVEKTKVNGKTLKPGEWIVVADGPYNYYHLRMAGKRGRLYFGRESMNEPLDIYSMDLETGKIVRRTNINQYIMNQIAPVKTEKIWINSFDGAKVQCWVVYPPNFDPKKKYPLITYLQGGPQAMIGQRFHYRWNYKLMASHGYVMILPNRRGLPGFGQAWNDAISKDWGGKAMKDIMAATDYMFKKPYIDKNRSAAAGASAGGYAAFWLMGHHEGRYKAFVAHCGVFDLVSMYGATEELWFPNWEYGGPYWDPKAKENYEKNSPHNYVNKWDTPILIITGERDFRVPYTQSLEAFTAARGHNVEARLLVFPDETHFVSKPQDFLVWDAEFFGFVDKYCGEKAKKKKK